MELKSKVTNSFLKTVSAFSNYSGGTIILGMDDDGNLQPLDNLKVIKLSIENKINDSFTPKPSYKILENEDNNTIELIVSEGKYKPYYYQNKAYKRNDTSTVEIDSFELRRLVLQGERLEFEEIASKQQNLTFKTLEAELKKVKNINNINTDILKILELYDEEVKYNNVANLISEQSIFPGIDIVRYGETINVIKEREIFPEDNSNRSIIDVFKKSVGFISKKYTYEVISGLERKKYKLY